VNIIPSSMEFLGYTVKKAVFIKQKQDDENGGEYALNPQFSREIQQLSGSEYALTLGVKIESTDEGKTLPFLTEVSIEGKFEIMGIDDKEKAMKINAVAIMFPYLRSTLSIFTTLMNINPVVLPTINLVAMFDNNENACDEGKTVLRSE
jgi:preprotein translocase subunit SecB